MIDTDIAAVRDALAALPKREKWTAYVHPLQPEELRCYADVVGATRDDDVAENVLLPLARFIAACNPERIARLLDALDAKQEATEDLYDRLHSLSKSLEGSGRLDEHDSPGAYATVLDAMNYVRRGTVAT